MCIRDRENSGYFFDTVAFAGQHPSVATGVAMGDYDAGAVAASVIDQMVQALSLIHIFGGFPFSA